MQKLSNAEQYCWEFLQDNFDSIPRKTITQLSEEAHVSISTISRTLNKKGYSGFTDFKQSIYNNSRQLSSDFSSDLSNAIHKNETEITRTINQLSFDDINQAITLMHNHRKIVFFSTGHSSHVASEMMSKLQLFNKDCSAFSDLDYIKYYSKNMSADALIICISLSGETPELIFSLKEAKKINIPIISLTAGLSSSIALLSDICFFAYKSKYKEIDFNLDVSSRISLHVLARILLDAYALSERKKV